jgi:hypothetical protein
MRFRQIRSRLSILPTQRASPLPMAEACVRRHSQPTFHVVGLNLVLSGRYRLRREMSRADFFNR